MVYHPKSNVPRFHLLRKNPLVTESQHEEGISEHSPLYVELKDTTWLKAVPYDRIKRCDKEVDHRIKIFEKNCRNEIERQFVLENEYIDILKISGGDHGAFSIRTAPVLHVKSITISNKEKELNNFEIYGEISVTDYQKNTFYIYKVEEDDTDLVSSKQSLYFTHCPIAPVVEGKVKFSLSKVDCNVDGDVQIFKKEYDLEYSRKHDWKEDIVQEFPGEDGYCATMVFTKVPFAVLADVVIFLYCEPPGCGEGTYEVYGNITVNGVVCFDTKRSGALEMTYGIAYCFDQARYVFAVPIGFPLVVKFDLYNGDFKIASGTRKIDPCYMRAVPPRKTYFHCEDQNYQFGAWVQWIQHEDFFDREHRWDHCVNVKWNPDTQISWDVSYEVAPDRSLVEIFSVFVGGRNSSAVSALCGRIAVRNRDGTVYIFARNKDCPDMLSEQQLGRTVSLAWPDRWVVEKDFYFHLRLKDVYGNKVCVGELSWEVGYSARHDTRICDVIRGENGYLAAVHYSVFKNGTKAKVTVKCNRDDGHNDSLVYGSVFAAYDHYVYPSTYDEEFYRSIIFKRSMEDCVRVKNCCEIPLSKSNVSAPEDCQGLIVDAELWVRPCMTSSPYVQVKGKFRFSRGIGCQRHEIGCVSVDVDWSQ